MPTLRKRKFTGSDTVEAVESYHWQDGLVPRFYLEGTRLNGDDAAVQANPVRWAIAGTPHDQIDQQRRELHAVERPPEPEIMRTRIERRVRDEDDVVAKYRVEGIRAGEKVDKHDAAVKEHPDAFVPVAAKGLTRANSYVALTSMTHERDGQTRTIYAGQWVAQDDEFVTLHPHQFGLLPPGQAA